MVLIGVALCSLPSLVQERAEKRSGWGHEWLLRALPPPPTSAWLQSSQKEKHECEIRLELSSSVGSFKHS